ncbi:MAG: putative restriction endonuclease, partial [Halioglobus sp.]
SEVLVAKFQGKNIEDLYKPDLVHKLGLDKKILVKQRVNQSFFRSTILSSYNSKCCISNLSIPTFLVASHIIPWSVDKTNRLNPRNGLCLNSIHDRAFDQGYLTITPEYTVKISSLIYELKLDGELDDFFLKFDGRKISLPDKFYPSKDFLDYHHKEIFID